jgi:hypothetical protein
MSDANPTTGTRHHSPDDPFLERAKFFREHVQSVLNVATGALVLSVTFLHDLKNARGLPCLRKSWECLVATIFLGIVYNYILAIRTRPKTERLSPLLFGVSALFHAAFFISMWYLARFGLMNVGT